jgi:hypothetical protein
MLHKKDHLVGIFFFKWWDWKERMGDKAPRSRASYFYLLLFVQKIHARPLEEEKQEDHAPYV